MGNNKNSANSLYIKCLHKRLKKFHTNNLTAHLKILEQKEVITLNRVRRQEKKSN